MNVPEHYSPVMPYFVVPNGKDFKEFITAVFDAKEILSVPNEDGSIMHGEYSINGGTIMFGQSSGEWKAAPTGVFVVTDKVDELHALAIENKAVSNQEPNNYGYGQAAGFIDPWGNQWWLNSPEDYTG